MEVPVSIIIPAFNEEHYLPKLLTSIKEQTAQPAEVIVADAFSTDKTREVAKSFGCIVVDGGLPPTARNNGAKKATQELLLFLDSDVVLPPTFLEQTVREIEERGIDVATCHIRPISSKRADHISHKFAEYYIKATHKFYPHATGCCLFAKKALYQKLGGFDETLKMGEDHNFVKRARSHGRFEYLKSVKVPLSMRRLGQEGTMSIAVKYAYVEFYRFFVGEVRKDLFRYQYGNHKPDNS